MKEEEFDLGGGEDGRRAIIEKLARDLVPSKVEENAREILVK